MKLTIDMKAKGEMAARGMSEQAYACYESSFPCDIYEIEKDHFIVEAFGTRYLCASLDDMDEMFCEWAEAAGIVVNEYGVTIDYETAVEYMEDDIREDLHWKCGVCTKQIFFDAYAEAHRLVFGEEWELNKPHPQF